MRRSATDLQAIHLDITADWWAGLKERRKEGESVEPGDVAPGDRLHEWQTALDRLIVAMRDDVAPPSLT